MYVNINLKNGREKKINEFGYIKWTWVGSDWSMHSSIIASLWALLIILGSPALKVENAKLEMISIEANR